MVVGHRYIVLNYGGSTPIVGRSGLEPPKPEGRKFTVFRNCRYTTYRNNILFLKFRYFDRECQNTKITASFKKRSSINKNSHVIFFIVYFLKIFCDIYKIKIRIFYVFHKIVEYIFFHLSNNNILNF